jgi:DNA mismatch endonuclease (patch repair protein)
VADIWDSRKRSAVMSRIRAAGNRNTELRLIEIFRANKITGWRRGSRLFGRPDFVFPKARTAIFVDGCFWHRHAGCKYCYTPKSRLEFWLTKFERNIARDRLVTRTLRKNDWRVIRVWECQLAPNKAKSTLRRILRGFDAAAPRIKRTGAAPSSGRSSRRSGP